MIPNRLKKGDKIAIVSLSRGLLGMSFCKHELDIAVKRLEDYGLVPVIMDNSLKDMDYLEKHPEERAADLKQAFMDESIKGIICAIGGIDTYKTIPYLMEDKEFIEAVKNNPKLFSGFSDTTNNHLMLNKLGLSTFYGPCLLVDIAELDKEMLPYTKEYFEKYFLSEDGFEIKSSPVWYYDRENYSPEQINVPRKSKDEEHGFVVINGSGSTTGKLYGGCIESIYAALVGDASDVYSKYEILPAEEEWKDKILFIETSDDKATPEQLRVMLDEMNARNIFNLVKGIIIGKPIDEVYYDEYLDVYKNTFKDIDVPVLFNVNFGHSVPRCILPYDAVTTIDCLQKTIKIESKVLN